MEPKPDALLPTEIKVTCRECLETIILDKTNPRQFAEWTFIHLVEYLSIHGDPRNDDDHYFNTAVSFNGGN